MLTLMKSYLQLKTKRKTSMKKIFYGCISAAALTLLSLFAASSCSSDEEYYESNNYTLAKKRVTRATEGAIHPEPNLDKKPRTIEQDISANFTFHYIGKDSTISRSLAGTVVVELDSAGRVTGRPSFAWEPSIDVYIISEDAFYHDSRLTVKAKAGYVGDSNFHEAKWETLFIVK